MALVLVPKLHDKATMSQYESQPYSLYITHEYILANFLVQSPIQ